MKHAKQLSLPGVSEVFMKDADVVLVLDDGTAILCHSQILSLHSTVLRNMIADLAASKQNERVNIPLADFTEAQCSTLLMYLYGHGVSCRGAAFASQDPADLAAAAAVARYRTSMTRRTLCGILKSTWQPSWTSISRSRSLMR